MDCLLNVNIWIPLQTVQFLPALKSKSKMILGLIPGPFFSAIALFKDHGIHFPGFDRWFPEKKNGSLGSEWKWKLPL